MAQILADSLNGDVNLFSVSTLYVLKDGNHILDDDDDAIDLLASHSHLVIQGIVGSENLHHAIAIGAGEIDIAILVDDTGIVSGGHSGIASSSASDLIRVVVDTGGMIVGRSSGVDLVGDNNDVVNRGTIYGGLSTGLNFRGDDSGLSNYGVIEGAQAGLNVFGTGNEIANHGQISSDIDGIQVNLNANSLANYGVIHGNLIGVEIDGNNNNIMNDGKINSEGNAVDIDGNNNRVVNTGEITSQSGTGAAVTMLSVAGETNLLENIGFLSGANPAGNVVAFAAGDETFVNQGTVNGNVSLGTGDDVYDGRGGTVLGTVFGGSGGNRFMGGAQDDRYTGGTGSEVLHGLEGDDVLRAGFGADELYGGGGDDLLFAGNGPDQVNGGAGDDMMFGHGGGDTFVFYRGHGHDIIKDFENDTDLLDLSVFGFESVHEVKANATETPSGHTLIDLDDYGGGSILLENFGLAFLTAPDMIV